MSHIQDVLAKLQAGENISGQQAEPVFADIMQGETTPAQIGALLMGLSIRGETPDVLAAAANAMREASLTISPQTRPLLDTCGTGGDGASTFNISTCAALAVAACDQAVAKHGNRAISSKSGSADVLEALGVRLDIPPERVADCIDEVGIGFLFAPGHHPAMKYAAAPRKELGLRSIFNLLGPLTNPAGAEYQVLGVFSAGKLELIAGALQKLGIRRALVVHGRDGLDEITTTTVTDAILVERGSELKRFEIDPKAFGIPYANPKDLAGGNAQANASILRKTLTCKHPSPDRDIVLLNAAAALWVAERVDSIGQGIGIVAEAIASGKVKHVLQSLIDFTQKQ